MRPDGHRPRVRDAGNPQGRGPFRSHQLLPGDVLRPDREEHDLSQPGAHAELPAALRFPLMYLGLQDDRVSIMEKGAGRSRSPLAALPNTTARTSGRTEERSCVTSRSRACARRCPQGCGM